MCLMCNEILANERFKPGKQKRHLNTNHDSYANKPVEFFQRILRTSEQQGQLFKSGLQIQEKYTRALIEASWLIAKARNWFNIGEELLPTAIKVTAIIRAKKKPMKCEKLLYPTTQYKANF